MKQQSGIDLIKGSNNVSFDLSKYANGVYMLEVTLGNSTIVKKIIKQ